MTFVDKGNIVLLDLRQGEAPVKGRIPRSVQVAYEATGKPDRRYPRNAPVLLYSDNYDEVTDAYEDLEG